MRIFVNASTVKYGGGLYLALNIVRAIGNSRKNDNFLILHPGNVGFERFLDRNTGYSIPNALLKVPLRPLLEYFIRRKIRKFDPHLVLNLSNIPLKTKKYQIFLCGNAFSTIDTLRNLNLGFKEMVKHSTRNFFFRTRLKHVNRLIIQTELQKKRLSKYYPHKKVEVIRLPVSELALDEDPGQPKLFVKEEHTHYLICLSRYYPHKNLEVLLEVAELIKRQGTPFKIILTIEKEHGRGAAKLIREIERRDLQNQILNPGYIPHKKISQVLADVDGLLFPTLLESYGFPYIEAMKSGIPVFTSDRDFAVEVCREFAWYFNPLDPDDIHDKMVSVFEDQSLIMKKVGIAEEYVKNFPSWEEIIDTLVDMDQRISNS